MIIKLPAWILGFSFPNIYRKKKISLNSTDEIEMWFGDYIKRFKRGSIAKLTPPFVIKSRSDGYLKIQFQYNIFNQSGNCLW